MNNLVKVFCVLSVCLLLGCAHLDFGDDKGLTYYDPKPYLLVSTTKDCVITASIVVVPENKREVKFKSGFGTADLSVNLSGGMITSVNQKTDTKIPETITSITSLGTAAANAMKAMAMAPSTEKQVCTPSVILYPVENGVPNLNDGKFFRPTMEKVAQ